MQNPVRLDSSKDDILVRDFREEDFFAVLKIIFHSFMAKFHSLTNLDDDQIQHLLSDSGFVNRRSFEGYFVAEKAGKILGVMLLKWKTQKRPGNNEGLSFFRLCKKYGFLNMLKYIPGIIILESSAKAGECYIEHIAVSPAARGLGVGTKLLSSGRKFMKNILNLKKYSLYVAASNTGAIRLYEKLGFIIESEESSWISGFLLGEKKWLYMIHIA